MRAPAALPGLGIDVVDLPHFARFLRRNEPYLGEVFTERELAAAARGDARDLYLATRWALKEAGLKALGTGLGAGVQLTEIEALGALSSPRLHLHGGALRLAEEAGGASLLGSAGRAGACVIGLVMLRAASPGGGRWEER